MLILINQPKSPYPRAFLCTLRTAKKQKSLWKQGYEEIKVHSHCIFLLAIKLSEARY